MNSNPDPTRPADSSYPDQEEHVRRTDAILREHTPDIAEPETEDETPAIADHDPANPPGQPGHAGAKQRTTDEQLAPEEEVKAGLDAAEDEFQQAGDAASEDSLNR